MAFSSIASYFNKRRLSDNAKFSIIDSEHINIATDELGSGLYGIEYAAVYDGKPCVAKEMHSHLSHHNDDIEAFYKEINTLASLRHVNIVQFLGVHFRSMSSPPTLIVERMWMSLSAVLEERHNQLPLLIKTHILHDVACGLQYLHGQGKPVVHRDLNVDSIFLTESLVAKIGGLGQAKALEKSAEQALSRSPLNKDCAAPEALNIKDKLTYNSKVDIFSFGCTIIHVVTEQFPIPTDKMLPSENDDTKYVKVSEAGRRKKYLDLMDDVSTFLKQIAHDCLQNAPLNRPATPCICNNLEKYIKNLEKVSASNAEWCKQDKLSLLSSLQTVLKEKEELNTERSQNEKLLKKKEEEVTRVEQSLKELEKELNQIKEEKESLLEKVNIKGEANKQLAATLNSQGHRLREDLKVKQEEIKANEVKIARFQDEIHNLQSKLKEETQKHCDENYKVTDLTMQLQKATKMSDDFEQQLATARDDLTRQEDKYRTELNQLENENCRMVENFTDQVAKKEKMIAELNKNLEENDTLFEEYKINNADLHQKYKELEQKVQKQESFQLKNATDQGTRLHQHLLELQTINEAKYQQLHQEKLQYAKTFLHQNEAIEDLNKKFSIQEQQLEEKSHRLSTLGLFLDELQKSRDCMQEKYNVLENECTTLKKYLESMSQKYKLLQNDLTKKEEWSTQIDNDLSQLKSEHENELNQLRIQHQRQIDDLTKVVEMYKSQIDKQKDPGFSKLLLEEAQCKSNLVKNTNEKVKKLESELKSNQKMFKMQIKNKEVTIKKQMKDIEKLEKKRLEEHLSPHDYDVNWFPYVSLPVKRIRSSVAFIKDKVFVTGGYGGHGPQGDLHFYLKSLERGNEVFCFHTGKCRCDSIASPVVLGGVASVNGQCVLVSGAEGNTLTGNVYVLCEEGSNEQWKKFSEPVPTPRILPCVCCYGDRWLIVCGGYACKEGTDLLEAVNVVEILDTSKGKWYVLPEKQCPGVSTILCCNVGCENLYVVGNRKILKCNLNKLTAASKTSESDVPLWFEIEIQVDGIDKDTIYPFSVVEVNGELMIIASISGSEDDVTCVLVKDATDTWRKMSEAVECQHCSAVVVTPTLELLLFGGSEKVSVDIATDFSQKGILIPIMNLHGKNAIFLITVSKTCMCIKY